jgi:hypothetical protein
MREEGYWEDEARKVALAFNLGGETLDSVARRPRIPSIPRGITLDALVLALDFLRGGIGLPILFLRRWEEVQA